MRVIRAADRMKGETQAPTGRFHGTALQHLVHETPERTRESFVSFEPGAHTHWHVHGGGQLLYIVDGRMRVQAWGASMLRLQPGDTVISAPGEKHWHGADVGTPLTQLAITSGEVTWLEDATPER